MNATTTTAPTTRRTIRGHSIRLEAGRRYLASRPFHVRGKVEFDVTVHDITDGRPGVAVMMIPGLSYRDANAFLARFNDGKSFSGRVW